MNTPIYDFVRRYAAADTARLHMPGHKGRPFLGCEPLDITEVSGTEDLIRESEANAAALYGSGRTVYGTGGSSQCVRAMVYLAVTAALSGVESGAGCQGKKLSRNDGICPVIVAARNAHKSLLYAAALCGAEIVWLRPDAASGPGTAEAQYAAGGTAKARNAAGAGLCACPVTAGQVSRALVALSRAGRRAAAVYVTSPDYLGGVQDIAALSGAAHRHGVPLLVDNAHGAYLKFLPESGKRLPHGGGAEPFGVTFGVSAGRYAHPLDLGADLCCDSAHKTLPVLTGGAYLHAAKTAPASFRKNAGAAMEIFGSTSPSWLILASLDRCNAVLSGEDLAGGGADTKSEHYLARLAETVRRLDGLRARLRADGWRVLDSDPLRITLQGDTLAMRDRLRRGGVEWEYADRDYLVLMAASENTPSDLDRIAASLGTWDGPSPPPASLPPVFGEAALSPREALFAPWETVDVEDAVGRICAVPTVSCPPAIPIAVSGERIPPEAAEVFRYYGICTVNVLLP